MRKSAPFQLIWQSSNLVKVKGELDERADLSTLDNCADQVLYADLSEVTRINSYGLHAWIATVAKNKIQLVLRECSPVIVEHFNLVPEFIGDAGKVESFFARYACDSCTTEKNVRYQIDQSIDPKNPSIPSELSTPCPQCGGKLELDQSPEMYLSFLRYRKKIGPARAS